jgi:hydroxyethylthiazole kinase
MSASLESFFSTSFECLKARSPVVLNITNYVAMDLTANALLAIGASPIMAHAASELEEMVGIADAVVLNIGTLDGEWLRSMLAAAKFAGVKGKPVVLDPVGAGASKLRTEAAQAILDTGAVSVVRGNASEILALFGGVGGTRGVDSVADSSDAVVVGKMAAEKTQAVITISGEVDYLFAPGRSALCRNGSVRMTQVTAMGCTASSLVGAFVGVSDDLFAGALTAMTVMGIAGEQAAAHSEGPGSLRVAFLDALGNFNLEAFSKARASLL